MMSNVILDLVVDAQGLLLINETLIGIKQQLQQLNGDIINTIQNKSPALLYQFPTQVNQEPQKFNRTTGPSLNNKTSSPMEAFSIAKKFSENDYNSDSDLGLLQNSSDLQKSNDYNNLDSHGSPQNSSDLQKSNDYNNFDSLLEDLKTRQNFNY